MRRLKQYLWVGIVLEQLNSIFAGEWFRINNFSITIVSSFLNDGIQRGLKQGPPFFLKIQDFCASVPFQSLDFHVSHIPHIL